MRTAKKRIIAFTITALMVFAVCMPVSAAASRVDGYAGGSLYDTFSLGQSQDPGNLIVRPGDEIRIPLTADMFTFSDGKVPISMEALTYSQLSKVKVRTQRQKGHAILDYVQLDTDSFDGRPFVKPAGTTFTGKTVYISVMFAKKFISVEDKDFSYTVCLSINGKRCEELSIELTGTMVVDIEEVNKHTTNIDISDGLVVEPTEHVRDICLDLGVGVLVNTRMFKGQKYCGQAKILEGVDAYMSDSDLQRLQIEGVNLPDLYPEIVIAYKLQSIGLDRSASRMRFEHGARFYSDRTHHVYGENLRYLGEAGDDFPYSSFYFVTYGRCAQFDALPINQ